MTSHIYSPTKGDYIKLGSLYTGLVEEVYWNTTGDYVVQVALVKNAFQRGASELHRSQDALLEIQPATPAEVAREIQRYQIQLETRLEKFNVK